MSDKSSYRGWVAHLAHPMSTRFFIKTRDAIAPVAFEHERPSVPRSAQVLQDGHISGIARGFNNVLPPNAMIYLLLPAA